MNAEERWQQGIPHDPRSMEIFRILEAADVEDCFEWEKGGDGDNGEILMFQLDVWFAEQDRIAGPTTP